MPVAWTRTYSIDGGKTGRVFATTMGAAVDLVNEDLRRLIVNAVLWASGMEDKIPAKADVQPIGEYKPTMFGFGTHKKGLKVSSYTSK